MGISGLPRILLLLQSSPLPAPPPSSSTRNTTYFHTHWHFRDKESVQLLPLRTQDCLDVPGLDIQKKSAPLCREPSFQSLQAQNHCAIWQWEHRDPGRTQLGGCLEVW